MHGEDVSPAAWHRCQRLQPGATASWEMTLRIEDFSK
jgi:hypothetical protein